MDHTVGIGQQGGNTTHSRDGLLGGNTTQCFHTRQGWTARSKHFTVFPHTYNTWSSAGEDLEVAQGSSHQTHCGGEGVQGTQGKQDFLETRPLIREMCKMCR